MILQFLEHRCNPYYFLFLGCSVAKIKSPISHFHYQQFDFFSHLVYKREGFVGRVWFFSELQNIFETDRGTSGVLITGAPGSGKSALMSQLICSPYSNLLVHHNIIGYHLCEYSEKGKRDGTRFVQNLVDQIAARFPGYSEHIKKNEQIRTELDTFCHKDVVGCFFTSILGPLRELKPPNGSRYIVIDALDECFESDKTSEIIEILSSKIPQFPKWLKVILTSRNLTMVTTRIPRTVRRTSLYANDERNVKDIRLYVSRFMSQNSFFIDRLLTAMNLNVTSRTYGMRKILDQVIKRAEGNFLFVKSTLQYMNDTDGVVDFRVLPTSLFDLYTIFFNRQFGKDGLGSFTSLFELLLCVASPLHLSDMEEILRREYKAEDIPQLINQVSCFLIFGPDGTVRIYHQSFADWLVNQSAVIHINETRAHRNIANFQFQRIRRRTMNVRPAEVIELFMHILAGNALKMYGNTIDRLNITKIRDPRTNQTVLHHLATKPRPFQPVLEFFIPKFATVGKIDANKKTPAFYAASEGYVENLRIFIEGGANVTAFLDGFGKLDPIVNAVCNTGIQEYSLIHAAAAKGHTDVVELLIKNDVSAYEKSTSMKYPTALHLAAGNGRLEVIQLFKDYGAKFDVISLHHAAARNHSDVVEFLLRNVGIRDTCLQCMCKAEHLSKFSVEDVHLHLCETALHAAVSRRHMDIVKRLLAFGNESLECKHHSGKTVLMDAVERNDTEMVDLLLEHGANVTTPCGDKISKQNKSKLCLVSSVCEQDFLYTVYCKDDSCKCGNVAIHVSAKYGLWNMAEKLTSKQVLGLTEVKNCDDESALDVAIIHGQAHFLYHTNKTYKEHRMRLIDFQILIRAVIYCSDNVLKSLLVHPINYYEHVWKLLLETVSWNAHMRLKFGKISPHICQYVSDEVENLSLRDWIQRVSRKRFAIFKLLIESYPEKSFILNRKDDQGRTLLFHAVENGFEDAVKYLVVNGADTRIANSNGRGAFDVPWKFFYVTSPNRNASYRCYTTSDGQFGSCNTTSYDEILRYLIWWERSDLRKCDNERASLLKLIIEKQMPLSLYELFKNGFDMNCKEDNLITRPFLEHLRLGGRQLSEVFQIFGVDILLQCGATFTSSELHLVSYLALPDDLGNFFKPLSKNRSPLQRLIDKNPDGVSILDKCYDAEGYLPIHRAAQGGNLEALKWFKSVGVDTQLKTIRGLSTFDLSILYLGDISHAELIASWENTPYSWRRNNNQVPVTILDNRKEVFAELLRMFFSATPEYKTKFPCGSSAKGLSPLHIAALKGTSVLRYVHKKASAVFPNLPLNCINEHGLDPVYVAYFYESVLRDRLVYVNVEQEKETSKKKSPKTNNKTKNGSPSDKTYTGRKDMPPIQFPDREVEYYMVFNYLYHPPPIKYTDEDLHEGIPKNVRVSDCPGYHDKSNLPKEKTAPDVDFTECSKIQVCRDCYVPLCKGEILRDYSRKYPCPTMVERLRKWSMSYPRPNRQISQFVAERLGWQDFAEVNDRKNGWPLSFLHNMVLKKHEPWKYLTILNEALEVADVRFDSRILELVVFKKLTPKYCFWR